MRVKTNFETRNFFFSVTIIFFLSRLLNILDFPLFSDEGFYLNLGEKIKTSPRDILLPLSTATQPLFPWLVALFNSFIKNLILAGRLVSVMSGFLNLFILYQLLKILNFEKESKLAVLLFLFSPFVLIYNRLAMLESLTLLGTTLAVWAAIRLSKAPSVSNGLLFGVLTSLGILTKATGFFVFPLSFLVLGLGVFEKRRDKKGLVGYFILGWLTSILIYFSLSFVAARSLKLMGRYNFLMPGGHLAKSSFFEISRVKNNFWRAFLWLRQYFTLVFFWLFVVSSVNLILKRSKGGLFFIVWFLLVFGFEVLIARTFFPRYLFPLIIPVVVIPAIFLCSILKDLRILIIISFIFLIPAFFFDYQIIFHPEKAPWPGEERFQFFEDWTSGKGYEQVALFLEKKAGNRRLAVFIEAYDLALVILKSSPLLKNEAIVFLEEERLQNPIREKPEEIFREFKQEEKYILRNCQQSLPNDWPVKLVKRIEKSPFCQMRVYQVLDDKLKY